MPSSPEPEPVRTNLRALAASDIQDALAYYRAQAGNAVAFEFIEQLELTLRHIEQNPLAGSLRFAYELDTPDLRTCTLQKFPHTFFYVANETSIDIWRLLHAKRDIPTVLKPD